MIGLYEEFEELLEEKNTINENDVDLYTWGMTHGEYGKQILEEWSSKNVGNFNEPLSPKEVYYSQLYKRVHNHRECPYCANQRSGNSMTRHYAENGISIRDYTNMVYYGNIILKEWDEEANAEKGMGVMASRISGDTCEVYKPMISVPLPGLGIAGALPLKIS